MSATTPSPAGGEQVSDDSAEQAKYRETCDSYVQSGLTRNVTIQFLINRLVGMGCEPPKGFIRCMDCGDKQAGGGFGVVEETVMDGEGRGGIQEGRRTSSANLKEEVARRSDMAQCRRTDADLRKQLDAQKEGKVKLRLLPEIFLCQQHLRDKEHAHQSIAHELIHAIDLCRTKMDPLNNCMHMACTEIRAENLSGECAWTKEMSRGKVKQFAGHGAECAKRRAALSLQANPNCRDRAREYVDAAFERCYKDTFPFDRHPNLR